MVHRGQFGQPVLCHLPQRPRAINLGYIFMGKNGNVFVLYSLVIYLLEWKVGLSEERASRTWEGN